MIYSFNHLFGSAITNSTATNQLTAISASVQRRDHVCESPSAVAFYISIH